MSAGRQQAQLAELSASMRHQLDSWQHFPPCAASHCLILPATVLAVQQFWGCAAAKGQGGSGQRRRGWGLLSGAADVCAEVVWQQLMGLARTTPLDTAAPLGSGGYWPLTLAVGLLRCSPVVAACLRSRTQDALDTFFDQARPRARAALHHCPCGSELAVSSWKPGCPGANARVASL